MHLDNINSLDTLESFLHSRQPLELDEKVLDRIRKSHTFISEKMKHTDAVIYGINTGFGSLCNTTIDSADLGRLQYNLLRSHACGTGETMPLEVVRLMLLLKIKSLAFGYSGVQVDTVLLLKEFYNKGIYPVVFEQGSLGASGDLAPLSHLSLPLIGEGEVWQDGRICPALEVLDKHGLKPVTLGPKEGLALINGTQFMLACGIYAQLRARRILEYSAKIAAVSLEGFNARIEPFLPHTHAIRNQPGQIQLAAQIHTLLQGSEMMASEKPRVQDPYSFRCIPQVHGASADALSYTGRILENELNAVTDNPNIFPDDDLVISGGNFHGQTLALSLDFAAMATAELASISERRIYKLISGESGLPPFLAADPGLESGFMIAQYTAAGIVSQNKQYCTPASVDSIVSSNGQEDHVSMGANAATKLLKVTDNTEQVLAIEMMIAAKAFAFRRPLRSSESIESFVAAYCSKVHIPETDVYLSPLLRQSKAVLFS